MAKILVLVSSVFGAAVVGLQKQRTFEAFRSIFPYFFEKK